jgi:hypothetical protein
MRLCDLLTQGSPPTMAADGWRIRRIDGRYLAWHDQRRIGVWRGTEDAAIAATYQDAPWTSEPPAAAPTRAIGGTP